MCQSGIVVRTNKNNALRLIKIAKFGKRIFILFSYLQSVRRYTDIKCNFTFFIS
nr:MAG TPA: hypothetical protein [Caudoviricetes sp.]